LHLKGLLEYEDPTGAIHSDSFLLRGAADFGFRIYGGADFNWRKTDYPGEPPKRKADDGPPRFGASAT
jgi:hypothetical protein